MTSTITVHGLYKVAPGRSLNFVDQTGFVLSLSESQPTSTLDNRGNVHIDNALDGVDAVGVDTLGSPAHASETFINAAAAQFVLTVTGQGGSATGLDLAAEQILVQNHGELSVSNTGGAAYGVVSGGMLQFANDGVVSVTGDGQTAGVLADRGVVDNQADFSISALGKATGVSFSRAGDFANAGGFSVRATNTAIGVSTQGAGDFTNAGRFMITSTGGEATGYFSHSSCLGITNSGLIQVTGGEGELTVALMFSQHVDQGVAIDNSGVIRSVIAIDEVPFVGHGGDDLLTNGGKIFGDILFVAGDDRILNAGAITGDIKLGDGDDTYSGAHGKLAGELFGGAGSDVLVAGKGNDFVVGGDEFGGDFVGNDWIDGGKGDDQLFGAPGDDTIVGGLGRDVLNGGDGADTFLYVVIGQSVIGGADRITDLRANDFIDVSAIDADTTQSGDQAFVLVSELDGHAGQAAFSYDAGANLTTLLLDDDGDGVADSAITMDGNRTDFSGLVL